MRTYGSGPRLTQRASTIATLVDTSALDAADRRTAEPDGAGPADRGVAIVYLPERFGGVIDHVMPPETVRTLLGALETHEVGVCIGGGWAVDALVGRQTRQHADLDVWVDAGDTERLFAAFVEQGIDRIFPWPGDRPWNFVLHDGHSRRVDLHLYETLGDGRLHYGSVTMPFIFTRHDLSGDGEIGGMPVRCEHPEFALRNHTGYELRDIDRHDVAVLSEHFRLEPPDAVS